MIGKDKQHLQLRFDLNDPTVKKVLPILDLLARKKNYVVAIALNEFFEKYGLYELDPPDIRESIKNYNFMRRIHSQRAYVSGISPGALDVPKQDLNDSLEKRENLEKEVTATQIPLGDFSSVDESTQTPQEDQEEENIFFEEDPQVSSEEKKTMLNILDMFNT